MFQRSVRDRLLVHAEKIGRPVDVDDAMDTIIYASMDTQRAAHERIATGGSEHGGQMSASRGAHDGHAIRIATNGFRIPLEPSDGCLAVVHLGGPQRFVAEAIADARDEIAIGFTSDASSLFMVRYAVHPAATMNPYHYWKGFLERVRVGLEQEELMPRIGIVQIPDCSRSWSGGLRPVDLRLAQAGDETQ